MPDAKPLTAPRPLSPHITVYRWKLHMVLSILHRATGAALALSSPLLAFWLWAAAYSPECFFRLARFFHTPFGLLLLAGWSFAFWLHFANGIRHLFWDIGKGYEIHTAFRTGVAVVLFALLATAGTWAFVYKDSGFGIRDSGTRPEHSSPESRIPNPESYGRFGS